MKLTLTQNTLLCLVSHAVGFETPKVDVDGTGNTTAKELPTSTEGTAKDNDILRKPRYKGTRNKGLSLVVMLSGSRTAYVKRY